MIFPKTHTATVLQLQENVEAGTTEGLAWMAMQSIQGQIQPISQTALVSKYGLDVDSAYEWFGDNPAPIVVGDRLLVGESLYDVIVNPKVWDAVPITSHYSVALREVAA